MRPLPGPPRAPVQQPIGRVALALAGEGIEVRLGSAIAAWRAEPERWVRCELDDTWAIYDRFPLRSLASEYAAALAGLEHLPRGNPPSLRQLCRDKLATQALLSGAGLPMPEVEAEPERFAARLAEWGRAFLKPRHGEKGRGVCLVRPGDPLPATWEGEEPRERDTMLLQQAVPPPAGVAGLSVRCLVHPDPAGGWLTSPPVARVSHFDPVANVDRGAAARAAEDVLSPRALGACLELAVAAAEALGAPEHQPLVELALDLVLDRAESPWLIEVNSRPGGRLRSLHAGDAERFALAHEAAYARPLRVLAARSWA
ncbi:MAG: hypothetical protein H6741_05210 [Alphaproteobacteria bacterium]|nr:hypothetical protein [Alphaproteobacteria bacterium]MCB9792105.1 hypothetical protein [Alphaproteobacteria bacterium]